MSQNAPRESDVINFHANHPIPEIYKEDSGLGEHVVIDSHDPFVFLTRLNYQRQSPALKSIMWAAYRFHEAPISPAHPEIFRDSEDVGPETLNQLDTYERETLKKYIDYITTFDEVTIDPPELSKPDVAAEKADEGSVAEVSSIIADIDAAVKRGSDVIGTRSFEDHIVTAGHYLPVEYRQLLLDYVSMIRAANPHLSGVVERGSSTPQPRADSLPS
jgi:hypothetical protein